MMTKNDTISIKCEIYSVHFLILSLFIVTLFMEFDEDKQIYIKIYLIGLG